MIRVSLSGEAVNGFYGAGGLLDVFSYRFSSRAPREGPLLSCERRDSKPTVPRAAPACAGTV